MSFVPLNIRSEYSMLESICSINSIVDKAKQENIKAIAITDLNVMHGAIKFYKTCIANNIKPIIGLEVTYSLNGIVSNILLYAMNTTGYKNLMCLSSLAKIYDKPIDTEDLRKYSLGLIAILPTDRNIIYQYVINEETKKLLEHTYILQTIFEKLYIGCSLTTLSLKNNFDKVYNCLKENNLKMVALTPTYFLNVEDIDAYITLKSIKNNGNLITISEADANSYFISEEEVRMLFSKHLDLLDTTNTIASFCELTLEFGKLQLPKYQQGIDSKQYLLELSIKGLEKRLRNNNIINKDEYYKRLKYEYNTIIDMGFADYFLIVWDYVLFAKKNNIYVGPGRGSAGASLVAYCLGITDIDPLKYNLLFERFLNRERITMPDIDIDFPDDRRDEVIKYVGQKYGKLHVAHICTFGTFQIKLAINDAARVYKLPKERLIQINKCINASLPQDKHVSIKLQEIIDTNSTLQQLMEEYNDIAKVVSVAAKIQGLPRNVSTHAAGIIITNYNLLAYTPIDNGLDDIYQTQYEASDIESLGVLKMDFLGLKNLTNISNTINLIKLDNPNFVLTKDENDADTYKMLANGDVTGVFQLESSGMRKVIMDMKTSSIEDIIQAIALYRPGPMDIIPIFIKRKFHEEKVSYPHPDLEPILKETYGTIVYQEQIMQIAQKFAGYSLGRADILRRAVSKKKKDVLQNERLSFVKSSVELGYSSATAESIYDYIVKFADYGFNKAHSVAYAKVAYITAYLKCHYARYYMSTLMTSFLGSESSILSYYQECLQKNIPVYAPSVLYSQKDFIPYKNGILFPLTAIKGLGEVKVQDLIAVRKEQQFTSFQDFMVRTKNILPISVIYNMIYASSLDEFGLTKKSMIDNAAQELEYLDYKDIPGMKGITYTNVEYTYGELLTKEKEVLGLNIKYNFFYKYDNIYSAKHLTKINQLKQVGIVKTLGKINKIKQIKTKNNEEMAFMEIEDDLSKIECVVFPRIYSRYTSLQEGLIIIVSGNMQSRTQLQIIVENIEIL